MTVYVSWNGATDVAEWRILGGASPDDAKEIARSPKRQFETEIGIDTVTDWVVVEALDAFGQVLGVSDPAAPRQ